MKDPAVPPSKAFDSHGDGRMPCALLASRSCALLPRDRGDGKTGLGEVRSRETGVRGIT